MELKLKETENYGKYWEKKDDLKFVKLDKVVVMQFSCMTNGYGVKGKQKYSPQSRSIFLCHKFGNPFASQHAKNYTNKSFTSFNFQSNLLSKFSCVRNGLWESHDKKF